jgi:uncharacterized phage protein (TIGR01671 family)
MGSILSPPYPLPLNPGADRGGADSDMDYIKGGKKMREIKFRAWHTGLKRMFSAEEMAADQLCLLPTGRFINVASRMQDSKIYGFMIPLQFTGILDKNGKEIYEGDVILAHAEGYDRPMEWTVVFDEARFTLINEHDRIGLHYWANSQLEIIGNIYGMTP